MVTITKALSVLKLQKPYSAEQVNSQFRIQAIGCHPDKIRAQEGAGQNEDAVEKAKAQFQLLVDAKEVLLQNVDNERTYDLNHNYYGLEHFCVLQAVLGTGPVKFDDLYVLFSIFLQE